MACTLREDSDQPGHPPSLIRVFAVHMKKTWVLSYPCSAQRRLWSDWADAHADLSLRWAHSHFVGFVMRRLILPYALGDKRWSPVPTKSALHLSNFIPVAFPLGHCRGTIWGYRIWQIFMLLFSILYCWREVHRDRVITHLKKKKKK